jgi:hypothetical protein
MAYAFKQEFPFTEEIYQRFSAALQDDPPQGLVLWVGEKTDSGVRLLQVWDSEADYEDFAANRLSDIAQDGFFASTGYAPPEQEPPRQAASVLNIWTGRKLSNPWPGSGSLAGREQQ